MEGSDTITTEPVIVRRIQHYHHSATRSGSVPTDKQFTGQRLDDSGLYCRTESRRLRGVKPLFHNLFPLSFQGEGARG